MLDYTTLNRRKLTLCLGFISVLVFSAILRWLGGPYSGLATPLYVGGTVLFAVLLTRSGINFQSFGFRDKLTARHVVLALTGVAAVMVVSEVLDLVLSQYSDIARDVTRFDNVQGSLPELFKLLLLSWTIAAIGEEVAFRVILMRGVSRALGGGHVAASIALLVQALVFGLVHLYQGPAGVLGTTLNGLIYGSLALASRGAIWPVFLAHGLVNTVGIVSLYSQ